MQKQIKLTKLVATVNVFKDEKSTARKFLTKFAVTIDGHSGLIVATGTLPGRWNPEQILQEFRKNSKRFQIVQRNWDMATAAGLMAA